MAKRECGAACWWGRGRGCRRWRAATPEHLRLAARVQGAFLSVCAFSTVYTMVCIYCLILPSPGPLVAYATRGWGE